MHYLFKDVLQFIFLKNFNYMMVYKINSCDGGFDNG
jgi:hypothetical protein